ncbi:MAG: hypothetical protein WCC38_14965 [Pseudonocardiaceae bacterium]
MSAYPVKLAARADVGPGAHCDQRFPQTGTSPGGAGQPVVNVDQAELSHLPGTAFI